MVSQERATAQLDKDQLAPAIGQEDLDLAVRAGADFVKEDQDIAHHQCIPEERGQLSFLCSCAIAPHAIDDAHDWLANEIPQDGLRQTLASHGCRLRGSPGGR
jgi:hypothetical protein